MKYRFWTDENAEKLVRLAQKHKMRWYLVQDEFPDLSVTQLKNKYYKLLTKREMCAKFSCYKQLQNDHKLVNACEQPFDPECDSQLLYYIKFISNVITV